MLDGTKNYYKKSQRRNMVTSTSGPLGKGLEAETPLKLFKLFFDDFMYSEIVT